ncbi:anti-sigma factor family protein [Streptomyces sp. CS62]|uniref:anti-sigma factor family protein n=1 Tax=Streptomyces sp. CS62 TaxID=3119268 RepID=UPI002F94B53B
MDERDSRSRHDPAPDDVSEISDLAEGLLSPARTAQVRRHLAECPLCADVLASLEEIRSLLGTLPGPPRMPGDVAGRIDAALAAEALLDSTTPRNGDDAAGAAAGGAAQPTASGAAAGTPSRPGGRRPAGHPDGAAGPGRRRARRRIAVAAGLAGAAACAFGILFAGGLFGSGSPDTAARTSDSPYDGPGAGRRRLHRTGPPGQRPAAPRPGRRCEEGDPSRGEQHLRSGERPAEPGHRPRRPVGRHGRGRGTRLRPRCHRPHGGPARRRTRQLPGHRGLPPRPPAPRRHRPCRCVRRGGRVYRHPFGRCRRAPADQDLPAELTAWHPDGDGPGMDAP